MATQAGPTTPYAAYKAVIDDFVERTPSLGARLVLEEGVFSTAASASELNDLVGSLSYEQRRVLSRMLAEERRSAFHDVLAALTWWLDCRAVGLTYRGEPMPHSVEGGMHLDYIGRLTEWEWPDAEAVGPTETG